MIYIDSLRKGIDDILANDKKAVILGEDIGEPYGGAFKVTKGIEKKYPDQVITTPMSESALTGITTGLALNGHHPILEIMFGDFITLCTDQVINHASKFKFLFNRDLNMVIRTPMGGYRGYGATHSQTLEKIFFGIPDISIFAPNILSRPGEMLKKAVAYGVPVIFIENKLDYSRELILDSNRYDIYTDKELNFTKVSIVDEKEFDGYLITYGGMVSMALEIIWDVFIKEEKSIKIIIPNIISPLDERILDFVEQGKDIYVLEEGSKPGGFNAEVSRIFMEKGLKIKSFTVFSARNEVIGVAKVLENYVLPDKEQIIEQILGG